MLTKPNKIDIADSNIALLGSELEKKVKLEAAQHETAWQGAGKQVGTLIWRIEQFKVVAWPKEEYGKFFKGDSYIVLHTYPKPDKPESLLHDVHFWLGLETTQDEAGTAAYKTVELDDYLKGLPVQYREVQGHESSRFLSYFPKMTVMEGGVETGFKHVKPTEYRPRLLQVKGNKYGVVVTEVPISRDSLNTGDVFILDLGLKLIQWNGAKSNGHERTKAAEWCRATDNERKGLAKVIVYDSPADDKEATDFWSALGGYGPVKDAVKGGDDSKVVPQKKLFRLSDASGKMEMRLVSDKKVHESMLDTKDVFIFDAGTEIFCWVGKKASKEEKKKGLMYAMNYIATNNRPPAMPVSRILEGGENDSFRNALDKTAK